MRALARVLVVALAGTRVADTKFVRGKLDTIQSWKYINRFCFTGMPQSAQDASEERALKKYGRFEFEVRFPNGARPYLALYYKGFSHWEKIYKSDQSCFDRIDREGRAEAKVMELWNYQSPFIDKVTIFDTETKVEGHAYFHVRASRRKRERRISFGRAARAARAARCHTRARSLSSRARRRCRTIGSS